MQKLNPQLLDLSTEEKKKFDELCKDFYDTILQDIMGYNKFLKDIDKIKTTFFKERVGVEVSNLVSKYIYKNIPKSKKLGYFLLVPTVSMYISNAFVYNDKIFGDMVNKNYAYFIQYINLIAMFTITSKTRDRNNIKKELDSLYSLDKQVSTITKE